MSTNIVSPLDVKRKQAQEDYVVALAAERGLSVAQLEARITSDLCNGVPSLETAGILTGMLEAARRVNDRITYVFKGPAEYYLDPFAPDYEALARQEPISQYQDSRESAGLA